ncbi:MAG: acyl-CoA dehydrogenase [Actinomycetia bacterium]|nr:acyl-CoA dehydrogenase [Actinomycetes bacterium]MCP4222622.1 acyl-CoA dehydrogenase [Actinomycetes bacterium]MCP5032707.1 acyl-CoA dehydrogenase [Actinomycetes bacterium]
MTWSFETDPDYQAQLDWVAEFIESEVAPLDLVFESPYDTQDEPMMAALRPLQEEVRNKGLWGCHLGPELGGPGYGQLKLALLNEQLGRSRFAPRAFGCQAPDSGNSEILAHYGTDEQKARWLQPLLDGEIVSCYSMTEPHGGSDPTGFRTQAVRDGDEWVITGEKWFSSNSRYADFLITMAVTNPEISPYQGMSMFIVPADTPGVTTVRNVGMAGEREGTGSHGYLRYEGARVPADHILGGEGHAFTIAQTRLGGGRIHHAMRTMAQVSRAFDMMCERALSRTTKGQLLGSLQMTQEKIADSWMQMEQFRLILLRTAWLIDKHNDYLKVRKDIAAIKVLTAEVLHDVVQRAIQLHGSLGVTGELPLMGMMSDATWLALGDGPSEVHKITIARQVLRDHAPGDELWPSEHLPPKREAARAKFAHLLDLEVGNL